MKTGLILAGAFLGSAWLMAEGEGSVQRLENAQRGMADESWPKRPDQRVSPLSGKTKDVATLSPRFFGHRREVPANRMEHRNREASWARRPAWDGASGSRWEQARWSEDRESAVADRAHARFQPHSEGLEGRILNQDPVARKAAPEWSERIATQFRAGAGTLRMYEGRLTRVRQQVAAETGGGRDLGPGRQEKFRPEEVQKMLSEPWGDLGQPAKEQSPPASPLATADN